MATALEGTGQVELAFPSDCTFLRRVVDGWKVSDVEKLLIARSFAREGSSCRIPWLIKVHENILISAPDQAPVRVLDCRG